METPEAFGLGGTVFGIVLFIFAVVYAVLTFCLPFIVYAILGQMRRTNKLLEWSTGEMRTAVSLLQTATKETAYQTELAVAALQRLKESGDSLVTHAQYQTEVTKHRLALETQAATGQ